LRGIAKAKVELGGNTTAPTLVSVPASSVLSGENSLEECFGPAAVVVEYDDAGQLEAIASKLGPSLTATLHAEQADDVAAALVPTLTALVGRVIWNGWPTGVSVSRALHHGGPYPATTSPMFGSIGSGAAARWLRPVTYQNWPTEMLPRAIREQIEVAAI
jgi:NADP-dependent aldehyde dehydrogenase